MKNKIVHVGTIALMANSFLFGAIQGELPGTREILAQTGDPVSAVYALPGATGISLSHYAGISPKGQLPATGVPGEQRDKGAPNSMWLPGTDTHSNSLLSVDRELPLD